MDILTPRGQESRKWEDRAIQSWSSHYPDIIYASTDKNSPCAIDAILVKDKKIIGIVEQKSRPSLSLIDFNGIYKKQWLVTQKKLDNGAKIAESLQTKFVGFLYLPQADMLLVKTLWNPNLGWSVIIEKRHTKTQATINGGSIVRENAYIDMSEALILNGEKCD